MRHFSCNGLLLALLALACRTTLAAGSEWLDVEGRIQYGFFTEDDRALSDVISQLTAADRGDDPVRHYYIGFANYRLSSVLAGRDRTAARNAAARCVSRLDEAVRGKPEFAEGMALQAACLRELSNLTPWKPLARPRSTGWMERAAKLAPRAPRVLLLQALENGEGGKIDAAAVEMLKQAVQAFEAERQGVVRAPGWGAAESYAYLGRGYLELGDVLAARDALERALLIAPDFAFARRLLLEITSG